jgi:hypothetical protein
VAKVVRTEGYEGPRVETKIRDSIAKVTNGSLAVDFEYVDDIPLSRSLKRRFVISELMNAPFSTAPAALRRRGDAAALFDSAGNA